VTNLLNGGGKGQEGGAEGPVREWGGGGKVLILTLKPLWGGG